VYARQAYCDGPTESGTMDRVGVLRKYGMRSVLAKFEASRTSMVHGLSIWHDHNAKYARDVVQILYPTEDAFQDDLAMVSWIRESGFGTSSDDLVEMIECILDSQVRHNFMNNEDVSYLLHRYPPFVRTDSVKNGTIDHITYKQQVLIYRTLLVTSSVWVSFDRDTASILTGSNIPTDVIMRLINLTSTFHTEMKSLDLERFGKQFQATEIACSIGL
jgi:hypothetical protein